MRGFVVPLAYVGATDDVLREVVLSQSRLTHSDPAAGWGAWIAAEMVRVALRGDEPLDALAELVAQLPEGVREQFAPLLAPTWTPDQTTLTNGTVWTCLAQAAWALRTTSSFEDAVVAAVSLGDDADTVACVAGALAGARYGVQAIPSRWATYVHGRVRTPDGEVRYRIADLQRMAQRLVGAPAPADEPPERAERPREVDTGVYAGNLPGAVRVPTDWAVVSLCRTGDHFANHPVRRQVYLVDQEGDHNAALAVAVRDAADAVDAFVAEGRTVLVHCHGGKSRTGLVLKAWKMRRDGLTEREAHTWLSERWFLYQDYNETYVRFLRERWP